MTASFPRRMLVITFSYAPVLSPRAFRWGALNRYFAERGWEVHVLTSWQPGLPRYEIVGGVHVHRAGWTGMDRIRELLRRSRGAQGPSPIGGGAAGPVSRGAASFIRRFLWRPFYWPDSSFMWYWPARRAATALAGTLRPDVIVSVSPTFTAHLVGRVAHALGAKRWILDVGDPFSLQEKSSPNNRILYARLNVKVERQVLGSADAVCVTTAGTAARYGEAFPDAAAKLHVIPPLVADFEPPSGTGFFPEDGTVRLVYAGTLYRGLREPGFLLQLFEAMLRQRSCASVELHLFGEMQAFDEDLRVWQRRFGGALHLHGLVRREAVAAALHAADVIVNIGNNTRDQLPSKVVEYAATGRPILNLVRSPADTSVAFLRTYPDLLTLYDEGLAPSAQQIEGVAGFLQGLPRRISRAAIEEWLRPYRLPAIAAAYERVLA